MRHAKSSWKSGAPTDHERPLNKRGRRDAPKVGAELARLGWVPELILSSDSARTTETFERMKGPLGFEGEARFSRELYHAGVDEVRDALAGVSPTIETVLVLGHNPGWEEVLEHLGGVGEPMKTACCALLASDDARWDAAFDARWALTRMIRPRELA